MPGMQLETDIPWSASVRYDPNEHSAPEQNARSAELSSDGSELVPYCVMPYVERLLKVCLPTSLTCSAMNPVGIVASPTVCCMQEGHPSSSSYLSLVQAWSKSVCTP